MATMARAKTIHGPYEANPANPVLTNANTTNYCELNFYLNRSYPDIDIRSSNCGPRRHVPRRYRQLVSARRAEHG